MAKFVNDVKEVGEFVHEDSIVIMAYSSAAIEKGAVRKGYVALESLNAAGYVKAAIAGCVTVHNVDAVKAGQRLYMSTTVYGWVTTDNSGDDCGIALTDSNEGGIVAMFIDY